MKSSQQHESLLTAISDMTRPHFLENPNDSRTSVSLAPIMQKVRSNNVDFRKCSLTSTSYEFRLSFGTIRIRDSIHSTQPKIGQRMARSDVDKSKLHRRITASFVPSYFLPSMLECTLRRDYSPWSFCFKTFNLRPDGSPIFEYCIIGNNTGVQKLIANGLASPNDVNSEGMTPLHVNSKSPFTIWRFSFQHS